MGGTTMRRLRLNALLAVALTTGILMEPMAGIAQAQCSNPAPPVTNPPLPISGEIDPGPPEIDPYDGDCLFELFCLELP